jgi:hypothetical protein
LAFDFDVDSFLRCREFVTKMHTSLKTILLSLRAGIYGVMHGRTKFHTLLPSTTRFDYYIFPVDLARSAHQINSGPASYSCPHLNTGDQRQTKIVKETSAAFYRSTIMEHQTPVGAFWLFGYGCVVGDTLVSFRRSLNIGV